MPSSVIPIAVMPVMAAVHVVPGKMAVGLVVVPPAIRVEGQPHTREMDPAIGVPAVSETVASYEG